LFSSPIIPRPSPNLTSGTFFAACGNGMGFPESPFASFSASGGRRLPESFGGKEGRFGENQCVVRGNQRQETI
jgi:hypothetical protein